MKPVVSRGSNFARDLMKPRSYRTDPVCSAKRRYPDEVSIRAVGAADMAAKPGTKLWCYRCKHCSGFHLTSKNQGKRWEITL